MMKTEHASNEGLYNKAITQAVQGIGIEKSLGKPRKDPSCLRFILASLIVGALVSGCSRNESDQQKADAEISQPGSAAANGLAKPSKGSGPQTLPWAGSAFGAPDFRLSAETFFEQKPDSQSEKKVFAWYMVCCNPFIADDLAPLEKRVQQYVTEIQMAQSMGIDGFGLDIMRDNKVYHDSIEAMFLAAERLNSGFKLFFEFDYGEATMEKRAEDIITLLKKYSKRANYQMAEGRPLVCAYSPDDWMKENGKASPALSAQWWRENVTVPLKAAQLEIFYVPTTFHQVWSGGGNTETTNSEIATWGDTIQGLSMWQIQLSPMGSGLGVLERQAQALKNAQKTWMSTIAMHYWCGSSRSVPGWYWKPGKALSADCINGSYYEHGGGKGLDMQWKSVMNKQHPEWVMILTWNDYNESYIAPIDDYRKYPNGTSQAPLGWYKSRAGLDELNRYYIQWYKTGAQPRITADSLFYSYRTSSGKLVASADNRPPVTIGNGPISDDIYLTTALTAPAQLLVVTGTSKHQYDLPAGINQTVVPFEVGKQSFSLWRKGVQIAAVDGAPVVGAIEFYDFWPTTGFVKAKPIATVGKLQKLTNIFSEYLKIITQK